MLELIDPTYGHFWLALGLVLVILEALGGAYVLLSLGVGAMITSVPAYLGLRHLGILLGVFAAASLLAFFAARRVFHGRDGAVETNMEAMVGMEGVVTQPIRGTLGAGYAKVQGEDWRAICPSGGSLDAGATIVVKGHTGVTLNVEQKGVENG
jgi:membrane protein implicated in regulation of membrane protease activity